MTDPLQDERLRNAQADEHHAKALHYRMAAFKELTIAALMVIFAVITIALATQLWPYLPK